MVDNITLDKSVSTDQMIIKSGGGLHLFSRRQASLVLAAPVAPRHSIHNPPAGIIFPFPSAGVIHKIQNEKSTEIYGVLRITLQNADRICGVSNTDRRNTMAIIKCHRASAADLRTITCQAEGNA